MCSTHLECGAGRRASLALLDGVSLTSTTGGTPEPLTWLMIVPGFAGLSLAARATQVESRLKRTSATETRAVDPRVGGGASLVNRSFSAAKASCERIALGRNPANGAWLLNEVNHVDGVNLKSLQTILPSEIIDCISHNASLLCVNARLSARAERATSKWG
jgi:hypothetical protein